jgi:hypothetical protein
MLALGSLNDTQKIKREVIILILEDDDIRETAKETRIHFDAVWDMLAFKDCYDLYKIK